MKHIVYFKDNGRKHGVTLTKVPDDSFEASQPEVIFLRQDYEEIQSFLTLCAERWSDSIVRNDNDEIKPSFYNMTLCMENTHHHCYPMILTKKLHDGFIYSGEQSIKVNLNDIERWLEFLN